MLLYLRDESQLDSYVPSQLSGLTLSIKDPIFFFSFLFFWRSYEKEHTIDREWSKSPMGPSLAHSPRTASAAEHHRDN